MDWKQESNEHIYRLNHESDYRYQQSREFWPEPKRVHDHSNSVLQRAWRGIKFLSRSSSNAQVRRNDVYKDYTKGSSVKREGMEVI